MASKAKRKLALRRVKHMADARLARKIFDFPADEAGWSRVKGSGLAIGYLTGEQRLNFNAPYREMLKNCYGQG
jgi:hypothetical protein